MTAPLSLRSAPAARPLLEVQFAVTATVASLLGKLPDQIMEQEITTTGKALGSLLFNMQMTGYMSASGVFAPVATRRSRTILFLEKFVPVRSREVFL